MTEKDTFVATAPSQQRTINLFCLPPAGGTFMMYRHWKAALHPSIRVHSLELAGRGRRFEDNFCTDMSEAVEDLYNLIEKRLGEGEFAFFGHSMGALLCYELINTIWHRRNQAPLHAFLSGHVPPDNHEAKMLHQLSDAQLLMEVIQWGGLSPKQLADKTLRRMFLPILRADFKIVDGYRLQKEREYQRLPCPISILTGANDTIAQSQKMLPWTNFTTQTCSFHVFPGDHFYIADQNSQVLDLINATLSRPQN